MYFLMRQHFRSRFQVEFFMNHEQVPDTYVIFASERHSPKPLIAFFNLGLSLVGTPLNGAVF